MESENPLLNLGPEVMDHIYGCVGMWKVYQKRDALQPGSSYALEALEASADCLQLALEAAQRRGEAPCAEPQQDSPSQIEAPDGQ